jgi:hypothetical protein
MERCNGHGITTRRQKMAKSISLEMTKTKETRGTVVFTEVVNEDERPHTFYILKETFAELGSPTELTVVLKAE